jgi:hypothetical protein
MKNVTLNILEHFLIYGVTTTVSFQTHMKTEHCIIEILKQVNIEHRKSFVSEHSDMHITLYEILLYNHGADED